MPIGLARPVTMQSGKWDRAPPSGGAAAKTSRFISSDGLVRAGASSTRASAARSQADISAKCSSPTSWVTMAWPRLRSSAAASRRASEGPAQGDGTGRSWVTVSSAAADLGPGDVLVHLDVTRETQDPLRHLVAKHLGGPALDGVGPGPQERLRAAFGARITLHPRRSE